jgi:DHA1 family tetracycline resistance protein-like MFS transporter
MDRKVLLTLLLLVFIDLIGIGIVVPVLPALFFGEGFFGTSLSMVARGILFGIAVAAYPLAQFFGAPIIGALSDVHGRKKLLILSIAGTVVGYILLAISILTKQFWLLLLSRIIDGFTGGNISIVRSAIADISKPEEKTKNFGLIGMAFGLGFIFGPFLGGRLSDPAYGFNYATPFWFAAALSFVNLILIIWLFRETLKTPRKRKVSMLTGMQDIKRGFSHPVLRALYLSSFLVLFGWSFFTQFFQVFLIERFSFTATQIGNFFAYIGLWVIITQALLIRIVKGFDAAKTLKIALPVLALAIGLLVIPAEIFYLYLFNAIIAIAFGFVLPNLNTILSNTVNPQEQGEVLGIQQSMFSLAQAIPPLIAGASVAISSALPLFLGAGFIIGGWIVLVRNNSHRDCGVIMMQKSENSKSQIKKLNYCNEHGAGCLLACALCCAGDVVCSCRTVRYVTVVIRHVALRISVAENPIVACSVKA